MVTVISKIILYMGVSILKGPSWSWSYGNWFYN